MRGATSTRSKTDLSGEDRTNIVAMHNCLDRFLVNYRLLIACIYRKFLDYKDFRFSVKTVKCIQNCSLIKTELNNVDWLCESEGVCVNLTNRRIRVVQAIYHVLV